MSGDNLDPGTQSALIWSNALTLLRGNATLSARQKGWFEGVLPEAIYGTTIILAVENNETQRADEGPPAQAVARPGDAPQPQ